MWIVVTLAAQNGKTESQSGFGQGTQSAAEMHKVKDKRKRYENYNNKI